MSIKAVVFDLDDTLYPEIGYVKCGFIKVAEYINKTFSVNIDGEYLYSLFKIDKNDVYNRALDDLGVNYTEQNIKDMIKVYRENNPDILEFDLYPGVRDMLSRLKDKYKLGIITDGPVSTQEKKIKVLDIRKYFDFVMCSDNLGIEHRKPDTLPFETVAKTLDVDFDEMVYIGDNRKKDFAVKKNIPITTVEVLSKNKVHDHKEYRDNIKPDYIIENTKDLEVILKRIK